MPYSLLKVSQCFREPYHFENIIDIQQNVGIMSLKIELFVLSLFAVELFRANTSIPSYFAAFVCHMWVSIHILNGLCFHRDL
jgi:hypothetical protein